MLSRVTEFVVASILIVEIWGMPKIAETAAWMAINGLVGSNGCGMK
jgi:hypothetical protein